MENKGYKVELKGHCLYRPANGALQGQPGGYCLADIEKKLKQELILKQQQTQERELVKQQEGAINQSRGVAL
jgi:hypothetical protein